MELILRVGKNGLNSYLQPDIITKMVADIALSMYIEQHDGNVFNAIIRKNRFKKKLLK